MGTISKAWVVHLACSKPKDLGYAAEALEPASAGKACPRACGGGRAFPALSRAAKATVHRILAERNLCIQEKVKYYLERRDPDFEAGMRKVLIVYQDVALQNARAGRLARRLRNIITVSVDEKPRVQAIGNTAPDLPPVPASIPRSAAITNTRDWALVPILGSAGFQDGHAHGARGRSPPQCRIHWPAVGPRCEVSA